MQGYTFRWDVISTNIWFLLGGLQFTLIVSATTLVLAIIGGLIIASAGGISGEELRARARDAYTRLFDAGNHTPIV